MKLKDLRLSVARGALAAATAFSVLAAVAPVRAQDGQPDAASAVERASVTAEELTHDEVLGVVTARGDVEVVYSGRILRAQTISYQIAADLMTASGDVVLVERDGTTIFSDYVELTGELKEGFAREVQLLLGGGARAAARTAVRTGGNRTELNYAVYSACDACPGAEEDGDALGEPTRIWQVKAIKVIHDETSQNIIYRNAWLEMFGVPVLYTPYLSHPDPTVERRSGFLPPTYGGTSGLGFSIVVPYYWAISPHQDLTFSPMFTSDEGPVLAGEYRRLGRDYLFSAEGSVTQDSEDRIRNHFTSEFGYHIDETWRTGFDVALASDDTYMRRYGYGNVPFLTNRGYVEGFSRRSYASVEGFYFQEQRRTTEEDPPIVLPLAQYDFVGPPGQRGSWHSGGLSLAALTRTDDGTDSRRLSAEYGWHLPYIGPIGDIYRLDLSARGDLYLVEDQPLDSGSSFTGTTGRLLPEAALTWSLPLERSHRTFDEVIEPIVQGVVSPHGQNPQEIPNEDSLDFEFDDTNLFSTNRFTGYDRVETGPRVNYGVRWGAFGPQVGRISASLGQSYRLSDDQIFREGSGLSDQFSDYVGHVLAQPNPNLDLLYRFRLDKDDFAARRTDLAFGIGPRIARLSGTYTLLSGDRIAEDESVAREELALGLSSQVTRYWRAGISGRYDLENDDPLTFGGQVGYEDECFIFTFNGLREYTYDRDLESGWRVALRLVFKTLADVSTSPVGF